MQKGSLFTISWNFDTSDRPQVACKRVYFLARVQIPDNQVTVFWSGYHLTFMGDRHSDRQNGIWMSNQHLEPRIYCFFMLRKKLLRLTCASFPPVACQTFSDISRDPVMTWRESAVITKHVISSVWLTWYFSSSRVSDQILKLLSPFVLI